MKTTCLLKKRPVIFYIITCILLVVVIGGFNYQIKADDILDIANPVTPNEIMASTRGVSDNYEAFERVAAKFDSEQTQLRAKLLNRLVNPKTPEFNQWCAAYYLGELHAQEAAGDLAKRIKLQLGNFPIIFSHIPPNFGNCTEALIKIGTPAIPAVIRNLAESDDEMVRTLSLKVIYQIEGDKDISALRLEKAIKAEKDLQKQARLQLALKELEK